MKSSAKRLLLIAALALVTGLVLTLDVLPRNVQASKPVQLRLKHDALNDIAWIVETVASDGDVGQASSLALDRLGKPHIAYSDVTYDSLKYAVLSSTIWVSETVETSALNPFLVLDSSGNPHIAYTHRGPYVNYAVWNGTTWLIETVDSEMVAGPSLALDSSGNPHVAYCDVRPTPPNGPGKGLKYAHRTTSGWVIGSVDTVSCDSPSLALDRLGVPHIAYHNVTLDSLKYAVLNGTSWASETVETSALHPSLALDSSGNPHIAYTRRGPSVKYAVLSGATWLTETVDSAMVAGPSLALDSLGHPHIAYCDVRPTPPAGPGAGLKYAYGTTGEWTIASVDVVNCDSPSLTLDRFNNRYVSYYDATNRDLKYARQIEYRVYLPLAIENH